MAKDSRLYAKFTHDFPTNHKIMPLSDAAFRCLIEATIWSCEHQTDGFLPGRLAAARWTREILTELCTNDDINPTLSEANHGRDGWIIRDFAEHQMTKAEIEARRERAKELGRMGGLAKAKRATKRTAKPPAKRAAKPMPSGTLSESLADKESSSRGYKEPSTTTGEAETRAAPRNGAHVSTPTPIPPQAERQRPTYLDDPDEWERLHEMLPEDIPPPPGHPEHDPASITAWTGRR